MKVGHGMSFSKNLTESSMHRMVIIFTALLQYLLHYALRLISIIDGRNIIKRQKNGKIMDAFHMVLLVGEETVLEGIH